MTDREKVIEALECLANNPFLDCDKCPYNAPTLIPLKQRCDYTRICADALALWREQEPRVMAEGEVLHSTGKPIWFESRGMYLSKKGFWILPFEVDPELHIRFVQSVTGGKITLSLIDYGKIWRCWTSRPSPEQMRDMKWEEK